jgi:hypothetical protein
MQNNLQHYFLKLNPPGKSFMQDMTGDERKIMQLHVAYRATYVRAVIKQK